MLSYLALIYSVNFSFRKIHHAIFLFPKEKWQKRKRLHGCIPRQIFNLIAKIPEKAKRIVSRKFLNAHKFQFVTWYSASAGIVFKLYGGIGFQKKQFAHSEVRF